MADDLHACFRAQYGLIHRSQVHRIGLTDRQIERRLATGSWLRERPGVYRLAGVPPTWESDLLAALLGRDAVASHRSAAVLWDLGVYHRPRPELSVPIERRYGTNGDRARVHTTTQWVLRDATIGALIMKDSNPG